MKSRYNKLKNLCLLSLALLIACIVFSTAMFASAEVLDEIQNFEIKVDMRPDGTMDINYHVEWKVLDDNSQGPLSWVKIGNPNYHVDEITAKTSNIKEISYLSDNGSYIRIDFDRNYYKDEIISFDYSIHQSYMYVIEQESNLCRYSFTAGWFDEIEVKNITIKWNSANVLESTAQREEDGYLIWNTSLGFGERVNASVKYNLDVFTTNQDEQYVEWERRPSNNTSSESENVAFWIFVGIVGSIVIVFIIIVIVSSDDYGSHGGFGGGVGYHSTHIRTYSSCVRSSCACACVRSCACACACAGGGRAGCSKKDFYGTMLNVEKIQKVLE